MLVAITITHTLSLIVSVSETHGGYTVAKMKDLTQLLRAVWKDNLSKVKTAIAGLKKAMYIDYFDKEGR